MAEIKYDCMTCLLNELSQSDNYFKQHSINYPPTKWKYDFIYIYITTILLNNRPYFDSKFDSIPWGLNFTDFNNSIINGNHAVTFSTPEKRIEEEKYNGIYVEDTTNSSDPTMYKDGLLTDYYKDYIEEKYDGLYSRKRYSKYIPDPLEQINIDYYYEDKLKQTQQEKQEEQDNNLDDDEYYWDMKEQEYQIEYKKSLETLNNWLTNNDSADIGKVLRNMRNALAHSHWKVVDHLLELKHYADEENTISDFSCIFSSSDMIKILRDYYYLIEYENRKRNYNNTKISDLILTDIINPYDIDFDTLSTELLEEFKNSKYYSKIENIIKSINSIPIEELLKDDDEYIEYKEINPNNISSEKNILLFKKLRDTMAKDYQEYSPYYKFQQIRSIIIEILRIYCEGYKKEDKNNHIPEFINNEPFDLEIVDDDIQIWLEFLKEENILEDVTEMYENELIDINVLLSLLFVQHDYNNIDTSMLDFSKLELDSEYIEDCKRRLKTDIDDLTSQYNLKQIKLNNIKASIKEGKIPEDKIEQVLNNAYNAVKEKEKALKSKKQELEYLIKLNNKTKFRHLRNAFAHGNYSIELPDYTKKLSDLTITIKDYKENHAGKEVLTFMGSIKLGDLLDQMLKPELITQLYMQEMITNNPPSDGYDFKIK